MKIAYAFRNSTFYPYIGRGLKLPPPEVRGKYLSKVRSLGYDALELDLAAVGGLDAERGAVEELGDELREAGLPCAAIRGRYGALHDPRTASENRRHLEKGVEVAGWIGAGVLDTTMTTPSDPDQPGAFGGGPVCQGSSRLASDSDYVTSASGLAEMADLAADTGVELSIEPHCNSIIDNSWSTLRMLELIDRPNVGTNPDIKNIYWAYNEPEETCEEAILALAPHANYWHCKNVTRIPLPKTDFTVFIRNALSDGEVNHRFGIAAMLDAGYTGYLAIEGNPNVDQLYVDGQSVAYARALLEELEGEQ